MSVGRPAIRSRTTCSLAVAPEIAPHRDRHDRVAGRFPHAFRLVGGGTLIYDFFAVFVPAPRGSCVVFSLLGVLGIAVVLFVVVAATARVVLGE